MKTTRRDLLRGASRDAGEVLKLLELELLIADVYALAQRSRVLSPPAARLARELKGQELIHGQALTAVLGHPAHTVPLGSRSPRPVGQVQSALSRAGIRVSLSELHDERGWFTLFEDLESALEGAYYEAMGRLSSAATATLAARILASEAQHQTLLFGLRHPGEVSLAVPTPIVYGDAPAPT